MASDEHVALLKQGVTAWNEWRLKNPDTRPDLNGATLIGATLSGNLTGAYLCYFSKMAVPISDKPSSMHPRSADSELIERGFLIKLHYAPAVPDLKGVDTHQATMSSIKRPHRATTRQPIAGDIRRSQKEAGACAQGLDRSRSSRGSSLFLPQPPCGSIFRNVTHLGSIYFICCSYIVEDLLAVISRTVKIPLFQGFAWFVLSPCYRLSQWQPFQSRSTISCLARRSHE